MGLWGWALVAFGAYVCLFVATLVLSIGLCRAAAAEDRSRVAFVRARPSGGSGESGGVVVAAVGVVQVEPFAGAPPVDEGKHHPESGRDDAETTEGPEPPHDQPPLLPLIPGC